jgi:hypothetical protein
MRNLSVCKKRAAARGLSLEEYIAQLDAQKAATAARRNDAQARRAYWREADKRQRAKRATERAANPAHVSDLPASWPTVERAVKAVEETPPAPSAPPIEAEAAKARALELEVVSTQVVAQLQQVPVNIWTKVASCSSSDVAGTIAGNLDRRWMRDGRTLIRCRSRGCDLYIVRQATVTA